MNNELIKSMLKLILITSQFGLIVSLMLFVRSLILVLTMRFYGINGIRILLEYGHLRRLIIRGIIHTSILLSTFYALTISTRNGVIVYLVVIFLIEFLTIYLNIYETFDIIKARKVAITKFIKSII